MIVDPNRLIRPECTLCRDFPGLGFRDVFSFETSGEPVLLTDPTYLADVYNSRDEVASFLRAHGVFVADFGGDTGGPVWWQPPFVSFRIATSSSDQYPEPPEGVIALAEEVGTDSGSFVFLPLTDDLPPDLRAEVDRVLAENNGVLLPLPAGRWSVFYEQLDGTPESWYRNIVLKWEPTP